MGASEDVFTILMDEYGLTRFEAELLVKQVAEGKQRMLKLMGELAGIEWPDAPGTTSRH